MWFSGSLVLVVLGLGDWFVWVKSIFRKNQKKLAAQISTHQSFYYYTVKGYEVVPSNAAMWQSKQRTNNTNSETKRTVCVNSDTLDRKQIPCLCTDNKTPIPTTTVRQRYQHCRVVSGWHFYFRSISAPFFKSLYVKRLRAWVSDCERECEMEGRS